MSEPNTVDEIHQHIGDALTAAVDEPWSEIRLHVEIWTTSTGFTGDYTRDPPEAGIADLDVSRLGYSVAKALKRLQTIMTSSAHAAWNRATFRLAADGQFAVDFAYDEELVRRLEQSAAQARQRANPR
jgi:Protein of unknown function, DUF600